MYARLYNDVERFRDEDLLQEAVRGETYQHLIRYCWSTISRPLGLWDNSLFVAGAEFLMQNVRDPNTYKCSLVVTRDGKAIKIQRSLFSECFYLMAMSEVGRATGVEKYKVRQQHLLLFNGKEKWGSKIQYNTCTCSGYDLFLVERGHSDDGENNWVDTGPRWGSGYWEVARTPTIQLAGHPYDDPLHHRTAEDHGP